MDGSAREHRLEEPLLDVGLEIAVDIEGQRALAWISQPLANDVAHVVRAGDGVQQDLEVAWTFALQSLDRRMGGLTSE